MASDHQRLVAEALLKAERKLEAIKKLLDKYKMTTRSGQFYSIKPVKDTKDFQSLLSELMVILEAEA